MMTIHTRKVRHGYTGFIKVYGGGKPYTISTGIVRLTLVDAKADATWLANDLKRQNGLLQ